MLFFQVTEALFGKLGWGIWDRVPRRTSSSPTEFSQQGGHFPSPAVADIRASPVAVLAACIVGPRQYSFGPKQTF